VRHHQLQAKASKKEIQTEIDQFQHQGHYITEAEREQPQGHYITEAEREALLQVNTYLYAICECLTDYILYKLI
jgi:hypothetical protein